MRIDKFLKLSRIIKRRPVAKEMADKGRILINDKKAKSGSNVSVNDTVTVNFGNKTVIVKVTQLLDHPNKEQATEMYDIVSTERRSVEQEVD